MDYKNTCLQWRFRQIMTTPVNVRMNPDPGRTIPAATYDGQNIPNSIDLDLGPSMVEFQRRSLRRGNLVLTGLSTLGPPTGRYNCHGLVFGSRRTNIPPCGMRDDVEIDALLSRDEYERISGLPRLGDIAIYRAPSGEIQHSGFVSRVEQLGEPNIFVWSKWGALEEFEHKVLCCPYADCAIEYWRLKQ
jgi:hypothetical protein